MKIKPLTSCFTIAILFLSSCALAQNDSLTFVSTRWEKQRICRGVVWRHYLFKRNLFQSNQSINILEITKPRWVSFGIGYEVKELKLTSEFGKTAGAIAALNGTFFDVKNGGSVDFIKVDGQVVNDNRLEKEKRARHQQAALAIEKGNLRIRKWNGDADWESKMHEQNIMESGPLLIFQQQPEAIDSSLFSTTRHPRTALVTTHSNRILLITVDGRNENAAGMNLFELRKILQWLNASDGINLDGGGSTTLWIYNQPDGGVVNYPCDNKRWDHAGERKVANVLLVKKRRRSINGS